MSDVPKSPRVNGAQTSAYYMTPGPGAYPIKMDQKAKGLIGDAPAFTMSQRFGVAGAGEQSPGPAYVLKATSPRSDGPMGESSPRYSFGTQGRFYKETASVPGPGHYPQGTSIGGATKVGFGSEKQRPPSDTNKGVAFLSESQHRSNNFGVHSPGPLQYAVEGTVGSASANSQFSNSPRYSMSSRTRTESGQTLGPGPGGYVLSGDNYKSRNSFSYSFTKAAQRVSPQQNLSGTTYTGKEFSRVNMGLHSPGPCNYETRTPRGSRERSAPGFRFGSDDRFA